MQMIKYIFAIMNGVLAVSTLSDGEVQPLSIQGLFVLLFFSGNIYLVLN